ncbi:MULTISPECIES: TetR/AcrR family transcriptional regulator [Micromonospora]|uniref:TetR/AcrR family transcriptional regulator n=1 Tax=Micromonospora TaxID=1873 RepID=UPI0003EED747|nr:MULTISPECIES: TetR/AcrR family transcriptional regulator [unclassified Micromonospora]EWM63708.1 TetR-family transcriptional regulator [Micromonospora sp. M42]MCK1807412.1 TetR/AcrR family transcriptional regulator [Micromonospora sp. R42106]MCK1830097.1 TetR/AcrR family transcriptional regulator [Micromonospora sp. R42003]MCK1845081.1 TetR/AcrR family transcriptional regulator [Micromonospora sp. R42004]MCM1016352.1 TetR/AcrR family transcriptional regulator [Micromonospora sp. XM-20-01]
MTPQPTRRNEQSRRAILAAALELLTETGYSALTVEAIAARAGVGKQTIYRWWRGKGAVILDALADDMPEVIALPDTGDLRADLRAVLRATVAEFADPRLSATTRAITIETLADEELAAQARDRLLRPQLNAVRARLEAAREAGQVRPDAALDLVVELLFGPLYHRWLLRNGPLTDDYADGIVDLVVAAVTPSARTSG